MDVINSIKKYFCNLHDVECNQKYAKVHPYSFHLDMVASQANLFKKYFRQDSYWPVVWIGIYGHDSIEDARLTYNDIINLNVSIDLSYFDYPHAKEICRIAADVIYACTELKGKNRKERHSPEFFRELLKNEDAVFIKLCDLIANIKYSLLTNSSMYHKYKEEWGDFRTELTKNYKEAKNYIDTYPDMIRLIDNLILVQ